jgi:hypothetical protein
MRDIRIATRSRCVRSVGDNKVPEMWPFSMEFVPEGEPEGCEWRRERGSCTLYRWGRGYGACSRKAVVVLGLTTKGVKLLCGRKK